MSSSASQATVDRPAAAVDRSASTFGPGARRRRSLPSAPPLEFDGYKLLEEIGRGAMGAVYKGWDTVLERPVAVKFIEGLEETPAARERFRLEARAVARLQHPNVAAIYRVGETNGHAYLISEFVRGKSLESLPLPMPSEKVIPLAIQLARGLDAAHRHGVMHRDIKPANVLLSDAGEVKLVDFGLAKVVDVADDLREPVYVIEEDGSAAGGFQGTPAYMAPEIWRGEASTFRSDIYSAGALLYHLCAGRPPHVAENLADLGVAVLSDTAQPLDKLEGADPRLAAVIHRCLQHEPRARYGHGGELRDALELLDPERRAATIPEGNPYRGLQSFQPEHRAVFFGRDSEVRAVLDRIRTEPFVLVAGTSGVGKSSLCRAGVLPLIQEGKLEDHVRWSSVTITPGRHPVSALAAALAPVLEEDESALVARLRDRWPEVARDLRKRHREGEGVVVFIDQLEELVTLSEPDEARAVAEIIEALSQHATGIRLLATVRGDFIARLASLPAIADAIARALYLLRPLGPEGLREAVVGPAKATGLTFEDEAMVEVLVEASHADGALPLLQFTLAELWDRRDVARKVISAAALDALGGVAGALARHADGVVARMTAGQRVATRRMLLRLVTLEDTRARRSEAELVGSSRVDAKEALAALVRGRIVVASEAAEGWAYEVAHEALIASWPTLRRWLEEAAETRAVRERLAQSATEWDRRGRRRDELWTPRQLGELASVEAEELLEREAQFVAASRKTAVWRRRAQWLSAGALVLLALGGYGLMKARAELRLQARVDELVHQGRTALEDARTTERHASELRARAFEAFDAGKKDEAEGLWSEVMRLSALGDGSRARAAQALEAALSVDPTEDAARTLMAEVLYERALAAERDRRFAQRDELLGRMAVYDDGTLQQHWSRPGSLEVRTEPAGIAVELARYEVSSGGARSPGELAVVGRTPWRSDDLAPGSYLVRLRAAGRAEVRSPVLVRRGERRQLSLALPPSADVPKGFVYVPPGAFLFGSTAEDALRRDFFFAAPVHEMHTPAFLIARHETTFGEWIEFLEALPPEQRAARTPSVNGGMRGGLLLAQRNGRWRLTLQPANTRYEGDAGERLRIGGRTVNWLELPVAGIRLDDAEAYAAWLDVSGKVPGARLCSEVEWERAARGADDREYPHGDRLLPIDANFDETYGKRPETIGPDEVGSHPSSDSPFGVQDLTGNVWEWTVPLIGENPIARGGSYHYGTTSARSTNREAVEPSLRDASVGLRVCATPRGAH